MVSLFSLRSACYKQAVKEVKREAIRVVRQTACLYLLKSAFYYPILAIT